MRDTLPVIEVYQMPARIGFDKKPSCVIWLIRYNGQIHEGGWANKDMALAYADKLFYDQVIPNLLPTSVKV
jgi:hypothetical protein